ncbi:MAG: coenzyme F420-0:L-glutamate ligase [Nitrososphaerales archaeon]
MQKVCFIPIKVEKKDKPFSITDEIIKAIEVNGEEIKDGDVIVISSKFVAMSEASYYELKSIKPDKKALELAKEANISPSLAQLILNEAEEIIGYIPNFVLTLKDGVLSPNAGIDLSNIFDGYAITHPRDPFRKASLIRREIEEKKKVRVGIVISDSRLMPSRIGTTAIAIGVSGFEPLENYIGKLDLFGKPLKVTKKATADDLCAGAHLLMGEANESIPIVLVRGLNLEFKDREINKGELSVDLEKCIYLKSFELYFRRKKHV